MALLADHVRVTVAALGRAEVAGVNAIFGELIQTMINGANPFVKPDEIGGLEGGPGQKWSYLCIHI